MEYNLSKHTMYSYNKFLDTVNEQLVDVDINLPDYCPDIEKILKCTLIPMVHTRNVSGGQLVVEGVSTVRILYCDSVKHNIRCYDQTVPFTATFNLKSTPEQYIILADTKSEYVNCRALSPRKLVVHGAFSMYAKVICRDSNTFFSLDEKCDLHTKVRKIKASDMTVLCQDQFSVTENISVGDKAPVESLLTYDVASRITEIKSIKSKLMLNAELTLRVMYLADLDSGQIEHLSYVFPVSRIIDCEGATEDTINIPYLDVMSYDLHVKSDTAADGTLLSLDVRMCYSEIGYNDTEFDIIDDVYSTCYSIDTKRTPVNTDFNHSLIDVPFVDKTVVSLDNTKIAKVIDIYSESLNLSVVISDSKLSLSGKANICMLIDCGLDVPVYLERSIELEHFPQIDRAFDKAQLCYSKVADISYRLVDDSTIELRTRINSVVMLSDYSSSNPVTQVVSIEDKPINQRDCSLVLYYADSGEEVWDISKSYLTDPKCVVEENSISDEKLDRQCMLMIPIE